MCDPFPVQPVLAEPEVTQRPAPVADEPARTNGASANGATPPPEAAETAVVGRACDACGAAMSADQDWCLECGTAAPGRLGAKPGARAMVTVVAITLLLAVGAVAASYAALSEDAKLDAGRPGGPGSSDAAPVAQAPPTLPPAATPPGATVPAAPVAPTTGLPKVTPPTAVKPPTSTPVTPTITPVTPTPTPTPTPNDTTDSDDEDLTTPEEDDTASTTPAVKSIALGADAVSIYDPYKRVVLQGDPADAYDDDRDTTFRLGTADGSKPMGVGIVIDLEKTTSVRAVELLTDTPGYRVEIYGTTSSELPPDILDARWDHYADRNEVDGGKKDGNVAGDDKERIALGGARKVRYLNLWLTTPPEKSPIVRIAELDLFG